MRPAWATWWKAVFQERKENKSQVGIRFANCNLSTFDAEAGESGVQLNLGYTMSLRPILGVRILTQNPKHRLER